MDNIIERNGIQYVVEESKHVEYRIIEDSTIETTSAHDLEARLNVEGKDNWELVTVIGKNIIFKRIVEAIDYIEV
ncbi:hypothetical protein [Methanolobus sp.]|jgi:hypothetical protein|uniref:hypothetical protein n=1 Tax=Methanolobus sp. TaxID=1874737 RepID=UPI0025FC8640|nr:hypothetical protein [Methanolobus sp.]